MLRNYHHGWQASSGDAMHPVIEILVISFLAATFSRLVYIKTVDRKKLEELKRKAKEIKEKLKKVKRGTKTYAELSEKQLDLSLQLSKLELLPSLFTFIPFLLLFLFMKSRYQNVPAFIVLPFSLPVIGNDVGWLLTYLISYMIFSSVMRRVERWFS